MQLRQLRYILEVYRHGNHISAAAEALNTSQPGVSKQIQLLEHELGFAIFQRKRNRVIDVTDPGREVIALAQRVLDDVDAIRNLGEDYSAREQGTLTLATTHTHARYILPRVIETFVKRYPRVRLRIEQGNPTDSCETVEKNGADLAVATEPMRPFPGLVMIPCFPITRSLVARKGHPILKAKRLTLEEIAKYPLITHDPYRSGSWKIMEAFRRKGIEPNVVFSAVDADVSKTYVELGIGISILASVAFDPEHDPNLAARDASHLFDASMSYVTLNGGSYFRGYVFDFISMLSPELTPEFVRQAMRRHRPEAAGTATKADYSVRK